MKRYSVHLTQKQRDELEQLKAQTGLPISEHIRRALDEYIEKQKQKQGR